ncbi:RNA polymerase sigma factor CarQ [Planctomycetes bacterium Pla163]|uniref:RNA polymerase sigma factor CarQ n=1 Tax=Rohdeia mirabilis TaxID=2528008 RepID=A0A518D3D9_9BACT|nr:RNA polymerase sigma factor CarQ [Planctomycetes bacterium Pla163]
MPPPPPHPRLASGASDEDLAGRAADGDSGAFEALVVRHGSAVIAALERMIGDHHLACDAAQDAWLKVHRNLGRYERGARLRPWLFAIALNHGRDVLRKRARRPDSHGGREELDGERLRAPDALQPGGRFTERSAIAAALTAIDERYREALLLVDALGLGYEEAAESLGLAVGTLKSRVHRGRLAFRELWTRSELDSDERAAGATPARNRR